MMNAKIGQLNDVLLLSSLAWVVTSAAKSVEETDAGTNDSSSHQKIVVVIRSASVKWVITFCVVGATKINTVNECGQK